VGEDCSQPEGIWLPHVTCDVRTAMPMLVPQREPLDMNKSVSTGWRCTIPHHLATTGVLVSFLLVPLAAPAAFFLMALTPVLTLVAVLVGAGLVLVTPAGLVVVVFVVLGLAAVVVVVVLVRLVTGAVSTVSKTRGLELPVCERVPSRTMMTVYGEWGEGRWRDIGCGAEKRDDKAMEEGEAVES